MTMPNFLIIGASKCGTTSMYHYLDQHPSIYMSPLKETNFFSFEGEEPAFSARSDEALNALQYKIITDIESYRALFDGVRGETAVGEASPGYIFYPRAPERIHHYLPGVRLIAILRDQAERAYSKFWFCRRDGHELETDFLRAFHDEENRIRKNWHPIWQYKTRCLYYPGLKRYFDTFDREQIRVYLYEDFKADTIGVMGDIFRFIGVGDSFVPDTSIIHHKSGEPRIKAVHNFLARPSALKSAIKPLIPDGIRRRAACAVMNKNISAKPALSKEARREVVDFFREDIEKVQELIGHDLSAWLRV